MRQITPDEKKAIENLTKMPEWYVFESLIKDKIKEYDSISASPTKDVAVLLARVKAVDLFTTFLQDIGIMSKQVSPRSDTFE